jgi:putative Mg2+ transporter-C (MgtC) family protein
MTMSPLDAFLRLAVALVLSGIIGFEREVANRPAGFRTHVLVGVGSTLIMIVSLRMSSVIQGVSADPGRIAAQVVSGIGFLGAGTILREGATIRGLTTAASLWVSSAIGLAVGAGLFWESCVATGIVIVALVALSWVERVLLSRRLSAITVLMDDKPGQIGRVATSLGTRNINIKSIDVAETGDGQRLAVRFYVRMPPGQDPAALAQELMSHPGIYGVEQR